MYSLTYLRVAAAYMQICNYISYMSLCRTCNAAIAALFEKRCFIDKVAITKKTKKVCIKSSNQYIRSHAGSFYDVNATL